MTCNGGISTDDFEQITNDFSRVLSYQVVTKTTDGLGDETRKRRSWPFRLFLMITSFCLQFILLSLHICM